MNRNHLRAMPSPTDITRSEFERLRKISHSKSFGLRDHDREDIFADQCEKAVAKSARTRGLNLADTLNNNIWWKIGEASQSARARNDRHHTDSEDQLATLVVDDSRFNEVDNNLLIAHLVKTIPSHLMRVGQLRAEGYTNDEISLVLGIPRGTVQYHFEKFQRKASTALATIGINSINDIYERTALAAA